MGKQIFNNLLIICLLQTILLTRTAESGLIQNRIIDGTPAVTGQFPWQVILKKDSIDDLLCGGSIIATNWVLTAAHCTYGLSSVYLMFGSIQLENDNAVSMTSTQLYLHPNYNQVNLNNDISLIQLPQSLKYSSTIQPIALVSAAQASNSFVGAIATIAGFGLTDDEYLEDSDTLLYASVQIIDNSQCVSAFGADIVISSTLCAKGSAVATMSICSGDSGGALVTNDENGNNMQIGINSFVAQDQCTEGLPSGYVRLTSFLDFISTTTGINFN